MVLCIGLAAALVIVATWWIVGDYLEPTGWFTYAPGSSTDSYVLVREREAAHLAIGLGADVLWIAVSLALFGARERQSTPEP